MTQNQGHITYALLALALGASLLYRPVVAAGSGAAEAAGIEPGSQALSESLRQDFDTLIREVEDRNPAPLPTMIVASAVAGTPEEQLDAARIQIGILQQAVVAALTARAEAEAELEALWRDSRNPIDDLKGQDAAAAGAVSSAAPSSATPAGGPTEVMLGEIHFDPASATLTPGGERLTLEAADRIHELGAANVRVSGYSDTQGSATYNMHLSLQRARSIADLLASVGVPATIIEVKGHGEDGVPEPTGDQVSEPLNRSAGIFAMVDLPAQR